MRRALLALSLLLGCPKAAPDDQTPRRVPEVSEAWPQPLGCAPLSAKIDGRSVEFTAAFAAVIPGEDTLVLLVSSSGALACEDVRAAKHHSYPYEFSPSEGPSYDWELLRFEFDLTKKELSKLKWRSGWDPLDSSEATVVRRDASPDLLEVCVRNSTTIESRRSHTRTVRRKGGEKDVSTEWFESVLELEGGFVVRECR